MKLLIQTETSSILNIVIDFLLERNIESYLVGGFVRDTLLKRETEDIDIAVSSDALEVASSVAELFGGKYILLDKENGVGRVILTSKAKQLELDFTTLKDSIEADLAERDFTIDAMAVFLRQWKETPDVELIDPSHGQNDIKRSIIRSVKETAFGADPVRLLRGVRLAAELGFSIEKETQAQICRYSHLIASVAGERIREELLRILALPRAGSHVDYLDELGLLTAIIPEMELTKGVEQPVVHYWDVFQHSVQVVVAVDFLLRQGEWKHINEAILKFVPWSARISNYFKQEVSHGSTIGSLMKLAALLHDIGKPETKAVDTGGRTRFLGHATSGAEKVVEILERLRLSKREIGLVELMVKHHMRPTQMSSDGLPSNRAIYRFFRDTGDAGIAVLFLSLADHLATRGPNLALDHWKEHAQMVYYVLKQRFQKQNVIVPPKLVDGHDLINLFGLSPGPDIGKLLEMVREAQAAGELSTREQALSYIRDCLLIKGCK